MSHQHHLHMLKDHAFSPSSRLALLLLAALTAPVAGASELHPAPECQSTVLNDEEAEAVCALPARAPGGRTVRFQAHFLGSHDDSLVSLRLVTLNGAAIDCKEGSKTESRFEDGEVTLVCAITEPASGAGGEVKAKISLHHLQLHKVALLIN